MFFNKILEIFEYKFTEDDKFFIVASDGVWEFIESQEVNIESNLFFLLKISAWRL